MELPKLGTALNQEQIQLLEAVAVSCRHSIISMLINSQSGHPGGSLSTLDYLVLLYTFIINQTNEPVVVSNGHISPAVYSILGEMGTIDKERLIAMFRKPDDVFEGHINREVNGVWYGTGPLGVGASAAAGFAHALKLQSSNEKVYLVMGDGENQEGQAYEVMNYAYKYKLNNLILFIDYNEVQLTASLEEIMPTNLKGHYEASGWEVIEVNGHDYQAMWTALAQAHQSDKPVCIIGQTVMGQGVSFMQETGENKQATWHGKAPKPEQGQEALTEITPSQDQLELLAAFRSEHPTQIKTTHPGNFNNNLSAGEPVTYDVKTLTDCRSAYGKALGDLAKLNNNVVALTADLEGSVKTGSVKEADPNRHIDVGIAEQHMVSCSGGMSLANLVPFCSTFGAFMSSRAKDQARVNDINHCNVKMVATHCGLSVGEDGPTHQAIDDISSFAGFFNTTILEPADPNQCDRMIRYAATTDGNFYIRMGRAKTPVLTKTDGTPYFASDYEFQPGKAEVLREGTDLTIIAAGPMIAYALKAIEQSEASIELIAVSSFTPFDSETVLKSLAKTGKGITVHDHNLHTGLASYVKSALAENQQTANLVCLGVDHYQLSGTADQLYAKAGMDTAAISNAINKLC